MNKIKRFSPPNWIKNYRENIWEWFNKVMVDDKPGYIRLCSKGDLLKPTTDSGLGWTALGLKLCHILNFFDFDKNLKKQLVSRIKSFQVSDGESSGYFEDRALLKKLDKFNLLKLNRTKDFNARRAETRQAIVSLKCVNEMPIYPLDFMWKDGSEIVKFIRNLPWSDNPWHSGSHTSHLVIFLDTNFKLTREKKFLKLIEVIFEELSNVYNKKTGSWYRENPPDYQKVNAAMKVLTAYDFLKREVPNPQKLIDYCLNTVIESGACNLVDLLYVLHVCQKSTTYRKLEIQEIAFKSLDIIKSHFKDDGGLSYSHDGTQSGYYGAKVSRGFKDIGDLHGTKLYSWSLSIVSDLLEWNDKVKFKLPVT